MICTTENPAAADPATAVLSKMSKDNELEIRYEKYRMILKNLTIMSDVFMHSGLCGPRCHGQEIRHRNPAGS